MNKVQLYNGAYYQRTLLNRKVLSEVVNNIQINQTHFSFPN